MEVSTPAADTVILQEKDSSPQGFVFPAIYVLDGNVVIGSAPGMNFSLRERVGGQHLDRSHDVNIQEVLVAETIEADSSQPFIMYTLIFGIGVIAGVICVKTAGRLSYSAWVEMPQGGGYDCCIRRALCGFWVVEVIAESKRTRMTTRPLCQQLAMWTPSFQSSLDIVKDLRQAFRAKESILDRAEPNYCRRDGADLTVNWASCRPGERGENVKHCSGSAKSCAAFLRIQPFIPDVILNRRRTYEESDASCRCIQKVDWRQAFASEEFKSSAASFSYHMWDGLCYTVGRSITIFVSHSNSSTNIFFIPSRNFLFMSQAADAVANTIQCWLV